MADDDYEDTELLEVAIMKIEPGVNLHKVKTGRAVLEYLTYQSDNDLPCLIILDYNMPELTGSEVLSIICNDQRYEDIPKVILSTSNTPHHIRECMQNGATGYFVKPNNMHDLIGLAKKMLDYCS